MFGEMPGAIEEVSADEAEIRRRAIQEVFGADSSSDTDDSHRGFYSCDPPSSYFSLGGQGSHPLAVWETVDGVPGLWLCSNFLSDLQQSSLLSVINREGWFKESGHNQAMRFGDLPDWSIELARLVREAVCLGEASSSTVDTSAFEVHDEEDNCPLPLDLLLREPLFDQLIVNVYNPGEGICAHIDLMRFDDGIAIISLESACIMHFTRSKEQADRAEAQDEEDFLVTVPVFLNPGSLVLMHGDARYLWKHEINRKPGYQIWEGKEICQEKRTSVTLRKLCQTPS